MKKKKTKAKRANTKPQRTARHPVAAMMQRAIKDLKDVLGHHEWDKQQDDAPMSRFEILIYLMRCIEAAYESWNNTVITYPYVPPLETYPWPFAPRPQDSYEYMTERCLAAFDDAIDYTKLAEALAEQKADEVETV
jgi:hypothetical protein